MKRIKIVALILLIVTSLTVYINFPATAKESKAITGDNKWVGNLTSPAKGTLTSTQASSFTLDMESIGNGEDQADVVLKGINLKKDTTYVYVADILSEKTNRNNIFFGFYKGSDYTANNSNKIFGDFNVPLEKNKKHELVTVFTPNQDYNNLSLVYKFGRNGYEGDSFDNLANKITVTNSELTTIDDLDYNKLQYIDLEPSNINRYKNYSYNKMSNIEVIQKDQKESLDTIAIQVRTEAIAKDKDSHYKIYLNNKLIIPVAVDIDRWYHLDYKTLNSEFNILKTISTTNEVSYAIIKNKNITNYRNNLLEEVNKKQSSDNTQGMNDTIKKAQESLSAAQTQAEMDNVYTEFNNDFSFEIVKSNAITEINKLLTDTSSDEVKDIISESIDKINSATTQDQITEIIQSTKDEVQLQEYKEQAISQLNEIWLEDYSDEVKEIFKTAEDDINKATTSEEIDNILTKAKEDIEAQLEKEKQLAAEEEKKKEETLIEKIKNPLTLDNIITYIIILLIATTGITYIVNHIIKQKKNN